jgi:hypothetical protein
MGDRLQLAVAEILAVLSLLSPLRQASNSGFGLKISPAY